MARTFRLTWNGQQVETTSREALAAGLQVAGEHLLAMSRREVPLEEGTLERSGRVEIDPGALAVSVSYDTPYARRQHEETTWRHDGGRKAKYLEDPMRRETDTMFGLVAAVVRRALR